MASWVARLVAAAMLFALPGCGSPDEKASKAAARFDIYYARRDLYSARVEIGRVLAAQDDVPEYWARLARLELADGRLLQAYDAYARVVELDPKDSEAIQAMAELSYSGGSFDDAEQLADKILADQPRSLRMLLVKGSVAATRRDVPAARVIAEKMLAIDPTNEGAKILLARVVNMGGDRDSAIAMLEKSVAVDGESIGKLMALLDLYAGADDFPRTARTFARLFTLLPDDATIRLEYIRLLYERGRPDRALEMLERLTRQHHGDRSLDRRIVDLWREVGSDRVDVDALRRFVARTGNESMKVALAYLLIDQKRFADAEAMLRPFVDRQEITAKRVEADVLYAGALSGLGRRAAALDLVERVLRFDANNPRALLMRARVSAASGDLAAALRDAQLLARDNPTMAEGRIALADIYVRRGEPILATNAYASAMKDLSDNSEMLEAYAAFLLDNRRTGVALNTVKRFTRENPRQRDGWQVQGELCIRLGDDRCIDEALHALEQIPGGMKLRRSLEKARAARPAATPAKTAGQASLSCGRTGIC